MWPQAVQNVASALSIFVPHSGQKRATLASSGIGVGAGAGVSATGVGFCIWGTAFGLPIASCVPILLPIIAPKSANPPPINGAITAKPGL